MQHKTTYKDRDTKENYFRNTDTHTTKTGFTHLRKTDNESLNTALNYLEDAISFAYYAELGTNGTAEENTALAVQFLETAAQALKGD